MHMGVSPMGVATLVWVVVGQGAPDFHERVILFRLVLLRLRPSHFIRFRYPTVSNLSRIPLVLATPI
jgi:hypothetical protein